MDSLCFCSHLHRLVPQAWNLFTKWAQVWEVHRDAWKCLTADAPEFGCKDAAGTTGADHLTVKKETDSSWRASEHVSAIWGSGRNAAHPLPPHSQFEPLSFPTVGEANSSNLSLYLSSPTIYWIYFLLLSLMNWTIKTSVQSLITLSKLNN